MMLAVSIPRESGNPTIASLCNPGPAFAGMALKQV
jgi:hypothetical protein